MTRPVRDPRLHDLLADDALVGLTEDERRELGEGAGEPDASYELAAAAADLSTLKVEAMPPHLAARIGASIASAERALPHAGGAPSRARSQALPWLLAAACAILAARGWLARPSPTLAEEREELLRSSDVQTIAWAGTKDPASAGVAGDVVWSESKQRGFMRFRGLAANDASKSEYQLWVFDAAQEHPIDGGVFDVGRDEEVIVPVRAKLHVQQPTLFAVTIEKPGGVVVSKKEHIVVVAPVKG